MSSDKVAFTKSLKFKLTIWYSLLLSVFSIILVLSINLWLSDYMKSNIAMPKHGYWGRMMEDRPIFKNLTEQQIELIMESRLADLNNIKIITTSSLAPLLLLSFVGGYSIATLGLKPLEDLNKEVKKKSTKNLGQEIKFVDKEDEISELIKSFNRMSRRLNKGFKAQKEFIENASHELKTPLAIIQANLDTALEDGDINKKELKELLKSSKENIKFMNKLTEDLLLLSILDQEIQLERVNIIDLVKECTTDLRKIWNVNNIKIREEYPKEDVYIQSNSILLQRAIMNILENAVKYSGCKNLEISVKKVNKEICILIKDDGKGVAKKHLDKIFDRFYRVDKSRSRKTGGSGLGLSITKEILKRFNAEISVESGRDQGVKFLIEFPQ